MRNKLSFLFMWQILRTALLLLAGLFLFLILQEVRMIVGGSNCNVFGPWGIEISNGILRGIDGIIVVLVGFFVARYARGRTVFFGVLMIVGGISNMYERIVFGCVSDYLYVFSWFPSFNIADILLTIAALGFLWENRGKKGGRELKEK